MMDFSPHCSHRSGHSHLHLLSSFKSVHLWSQTHVTFTFLFFPPTDVVSIIAAFSLSLSLSPSLSLSLSLSPDPYPFPMILQFAIQFSGHLVLNSQRVILYPLSL